MSHDSEDIHFFLKHLIDGDEELKPVEESLGILNGIRSSYRESNTMIDLFFLNTIQRHKMNIHKAREEIKKLRELLEKLTSPPYYAAAFVRFFDEAIRSEAVVHYGNSRRIVTIDSRMQEAILLPGDEVYLGPELNVIMKKPLTDSPRCGEIAYFEEYVHEHRLLLQHRDEKVIVDAAESLRRVELKPGDMVHFDRTVQMAYEKIDNARDREFFIEHDPDVSQEDVGGHEEILGELYDIVLSQVEDPEGACKYDLTGSACVLLYGPPGTGKTLMAKFIASTVLKLTGRRGSFAVVKPGEFESPWVGETQANIRNTFRRLREASEQGPVILFMDEIEAVGRIRGGVSSHHSDKFLAALLTELDGFVALGKVVVISASNRKDLIEPALLERLTADGEFCVKRPDIHGARAIFNIHLKATLPYRANGSSPEETREVIIETAVSRMYSPNSTDNQICTLKFRDGSTRIIEARELVSGRLIKQICTVARREALRRKNRGGEPGLCVLDIERALSRAMERLRDGTLTPGNAREHIPDLPQDADIVSVEPLRPGGVKPEARYLVLDIA